MVDTDLQGSLYYIKDEFPDLSFVNLNQLDDIQALDYDLVIVDTPPYLSNKLPELFLHSDFILVPTRAGLFDVMAIRSTLALISEAQEKQPDIRAAIVLNMVKHRSRLTQEIWSLLRDLGMPLLQTIIHDRVSIARSSLTGGVINSNDTKAKTEITALAEEIVSMITGL